MTLPRSLAAALAATLAAAQPAAVRAADAPAVATDIPPVHALVARVMEGVGAPTLVIPPGASPHGYAMRPSEARAVAAAEVVFWIGPALTPWLGDRIEALAPSARSVPLMEAPGVRLLPIRTGARFEAHDHAHGHGHDHGHADDHAEDDAHAKAGHDHDHDHDHGAEAKAAGGDHGHDHAHGGDDHAHGGHDQAHGGDDDHAHGDDDHAREGHGDDHGGRMDEHAWLDPANAQAWLAAIAEALAEADPARGDLYRANAAAGAAELEALSAELAARLEPVRDTPYIVFHDAYQYFEARFGVAAAGAISLGDASRPSAARLREIREVLAETGAVCVFAEPQFEPKLVATVIEGSAARAATLDPLGASLEPSAGLYPALLTRLADDLAGCLGAGG